MARPIGDKKIVSKVMIVIDVELKVILRVDH